MNLKLAGGILVFFISLIQPRFLFALDVSEYKNRKPSSAPYFSLGGGIVLTHGNYDLKDSDVQIESENGFSVRVAIGHNWTSYRNKWSGFRLETEFSYKRRNLKRSHNTVTSQSWSLHGTQSHFTHTINGYWEPSYFKKMYPYIGMGIGYNVIAWEDARSDSDSNGFSASDTVVAGQIILGLSYKISKKLFLDFDYRYVYSPNIKLEFISSVESEYNNQGVSVLSASIRFF